MNNINNRPVNSDNSNVTKLLPRTVETSKEIGDYLYARLMEKGRVYQKKTKCSDFERIRFENHSIGALLAAVGLNPSIIKDSNL